MVRMIMLTLLLSGCSSNRESQSRITDCTMTANGVELYCGVETRDSQREGEVMTPATAAGTGNK